MDFFRFPHTPHLAWLGQGQPRDDKVLPPDETKELLDHDVVVEEKVDGANVGFSADEDGDLQVQNRGSLLSRESCPPSSPHSGDGSNRSKTHWPKPSSPI